VAELVLDASTAILLAKADLLRSVALKTDCWIGEIAAAEALAKQTDDAVAIATLLEAGEIGRDSIGEGEMDKLMRDFNLHAGEAEAVLLAKSRSAVCGTDDGRAIRCCKVLGVKFTTAVSLLVALAEAGEVESALASERLQMLERFGRYDTRILEDAALRIRAVGSNGEKG
jgi:predicted nucleic acid-binding protein